MGRIDRLQLPPSRGSGGAPCPAPTPRSAAIGGGVANLHHLSCCFLLVLCLCLMLHLRCRAAMVAALLT